MRMRTRIRMCSREHQAGGRRVLSLRQQGLLGPRHQELDPFIPVLGAIEPDQPLTLIFEIEVDVRPSQRKDLLFGYPVLSPQMAAGP